KVDGTTPKSVTDSLQASSRSCAARSSQATGRRCEVSLSEYRPNMHPQHVRPNVHPVVRADAQDVHVVRRVVDLAEGEAVGDLGEAAFVAVLGDMRGVGQI